MFGIIKKSLARTAVIGVQLPDLLSPNGRLKIERWLIIMRKLFTLKNGRLVFYACVWDCGMYSIERITKSFGGTVATFETLDELKKYAKENNYKIA